MNSLIDKAYTNSKEQEIYRGKAQLKKINIDVIAENITKSCWNYNIQYQIFLKTSNLLIMKLIGIEKTTLFKYHRKQKVSLRDYEEFLRYLDICNIEKGIYITTGIFEESINKSIKSIFGRRVQRVDGVKLIKRQLRANQLSFLEYLPQ